MNGVASHYQKIRFELPYKGLNTVFWEEGEKVQEGKTGREEARGREGTGEEEEEDEEWGGKRKARERGREKCVVGISTYFRPWYKQWVRETLFMHAQVADLFE